MRLLQPTSRRVVRSQFCHVATGTKADPYLVPIRDDLYGDRSLGCWKRVMEAEGWRFDKETNEGINEALLHEGVKGIDKGESGDSLY